MNRIGFLELVNRTRDLTPEESDELANLVRLAKGRARMRSWYRKNRVSILAERKHRYHSDPEFRSRQIKASSEYQRRRLGRA